MAKATLSNGIVVIGAGNLTRGDDAIGRLLLRALAKKCPPEIRLVEIGGEASQVLEAITGATGVIVVDACKSEAPSGTIHRFDVAMSPIPVSMRSFSSHSFGVAAGLELARSLECMPSVCIVFAVEVENFTPGTTLSHGVSSCFNELLVCVEQEIERLNRSHVSLIMKV